MGLAAFVIGGCSSLPKATYTTANGCGIAQWTATYVQQSVDSISWTGGCESGLAKGSGTLLAKLKNGKQMLYSGVMEKGFITGDGSYAKESGWKYEGTFLWGMFISGRIVDSAGKLRFDGRMKHNEDYNGQNLTFSDQRYHEGTLYFADGSYIDDGRYTGSSGPSIDSAAVDPRTGAGIVFGKYIKDNQVVYRLVAGKRYANDLAFIEAKGNYYASLTAAMNVQIAAAQIAQAEKSALDRKEAFAMLGGAAAAAAGGATKADRMQLAKDALDGNSSSTSGASKTSSANPSSNMVEVTGSMAHCFKVVPAGEDPSIDTSTWAAGEPRARIESAVVLVNTCPKYIVVHSCDIAGGRNVLSNEVKAVENSCENGYGGGTISRSGVIPIANPLGPHTSRRFNFFDRKLILTPRSIFACDEQTEQIEVVRKYGKTLAGNRACVKRRSSGPYTPGPLDPQIIPPPS